MSPLERKTSTEVEDESVALVSHPKPVKRKRNASSSIPQPKSKRMKPDNWNTKHMEWIRKNYPDLVTQHAKSRVGWCSSNLPPEVLFLSPRCLTEREGHAPNGNDNNKNSTTTTTANNNNIDENNSNNNSRTQGIVFDILNHSRSFVVSLLYSPVYLPLSAQPPADQSAATSPPSSWRSSSRGWTVATKSGAPNFLPFPA